MAHLFETGIFTDNQPAWHGLGIVVPDEYLTREQVYAIEPLLGSPILRSTDLFGAYEVDGETMIADTSDWVMNIRQLDGKCVGLTSPTWELIQPDETFEFGEAIVAEGGKIKTTGLLKGGRVMWVLIEIPDAAKIAGEEYARHLLVVNSFDRSTGFVACTTSTRVVCWNTLSWAMEGTKRSYTIRHTANARERLMEAKAALQLGYDYHEHLRVISERLAAERLTVNAARGFFERLVPFTPESQVSDVARKNIEVKRENLYFIWKQSPNLEEIRGSLLGAVQAASEFEQHYGFDRKPEQTFSRFMVDGNQPLTARAMAEARDLVGV